MNIILEDLLKIGCVHTRNTESLKGFFCAGVSTDTRTLKAGEVFFALRGESLDGHEFVGKAFSRGAVCAVVEQGINLDAFSGKSIIVVDDTTKALGKLASVYRRKFDIPVIAVAGSNGKTTTKEMISAVLRTQLNVLSTQGNLNNHIGVPLTLFRLEQRHDIAVVEIGTNHYGELQYLCEVLTPTHGVITNIGHEHMEFLKNIDGVAQAEGELFDAIASAGVGYVNMDDKRVAEQSVKLDNKITFGFSNSTLDVRGTMLTINSDGCISFLIESKEKEKIKVQLSVPGKHMMYNGLTAAAVGFSRGIQAVNIQKALEQFTAVGKRTETVKTGGVIIIDDSYNANPDSVWSALETLSLMQSKGKKIVVLGDMLELGAASVDEHKKIGTILAHIGFEYLLTYGPTAKHISENAKIKINRHFELKQDLTTYLVELVKPGDIVLVKGSRGMRMEDVVTFLHEKLDQTAL